jgi:hypothetical protein
LQEVAVTEAVAVKPVPAVMETDTGDAVLHPVLSVTVTECDPAANPVMIAGDTPDV